MNQSIRYACVICLLWALGGCTALVVGGAAGGGYYVGKDERSLGQITSDASTTAAVKTKLMRDDEISAMDINVDTYRGVVTLHGTVPSRHAAERAVVLAKSAKGVKQVVSKLTVVPK